MRTEDRSDRHSLQPPEAEPSGVIGPSTPMTVGSIRVVWPSQGARNPPSVPAPMEVSLPGRLGGPAATATIRDMIGMDDNPGGFWHRPALRVRPLQRVPESNWESDCSELPAATAEGRFA